jgi:hypothetical protein
MLTFKPCKHNTNVKLQLQWDKTYLYWCKYHNFQNILKHPKNGKHEFNAIAYAKETQVKYICYSLTSRDPFLKLFSLDTMPCVHRVSFCCDNHLSSTLMNVKLMIIQLELNAIGYKLVFIIIQSLHQTHDMHSYQSLKNVNQTQ